MINTTFAKFDKELINQTTDFNEKITVCTDKGNVVILSEKEYNNLMETIYLSSVPGMKEELIEGLNAPDSEFVPEEEVVW